MPRIAKWRYSEGDPPHLGDAIEDFLSSYGITKEWWAEFLEKHKLPPCRCDDNQKWINETASAHPTIANIGVELLSFLTRKTP